MKRLLFVLFILGFYANIFAAGTCVITESRTGGDIRWIQYTCTADDDDATVTDYTVTGFDGFYLHSVETWPGSPSPTDATDLQLLDAVSGFDLLGGNGTNGIDATTPVVILPSVAATTFYHMIKGNLTIDIDSNAASSAVMQIRITGTKDK